jgi:hypothetical protein
MFNRDKILVDQEGGEWHFKDLPPPLLIFIFTLNTSFKNWTISQSLNLQIVGNIEFNTYMYEVECWLTYIYIYIYIYTHTHTHTQFINTKKCFISTKSLRNISLKSHSWMEWYQWLNQLGNCGESKRHNLYMLLHHHRENGSSSLLDKQHPQLRCPSHVCKWKSLGIMYGTRLIEPKFNEKAQIVHRPIISNLSWNHMGYVLEGKKRVSTMNVCYDILLTSCFLFSWVRV